jgi:hypothetical protein
MLYVHERGSGMKYRVTVRTLAPVVATITVNSSSESEAASAALAEIRDFVTHFQTAIRAGERFVEGDPCNWELDDVYTGGLDPDQITATDVEELDEREYLP